MVVAFVSQVERPEHWLPRLQPRLPNAEFRVYPDLGDRAEIDVALVAQPEPGVLASLPRLGFIQSLWMGVDALLADQTFPGGFRSRA